MVEWRRNLWSLWFGCIISSSCYTMLVPFLPLYLHDLGVTDSSINIWSGLIFGAAFFVSALVAPYWGRLADKTGKRRMVVRAGLSLAVVYFFGSLVETPLQLLVVRLFQGLATGFVPAALAIVASSAPEEEMGVSLGLMQTATLTGMIFGPLFGGVFSHLFGIRASFMVAAALMALDTLAVRLLVVEPARHAEAEVGSVLSDLRASLANPVLRQMVLMVLLAQVAMMALQPLITLHVAELQGSVSGAVLSSGFVFSAAGLAGAIASPLWGRLGHRIGFYRVLVAVFAGAGLFVLLPYFSASLWLFGLLQFAFGFFIAGVSPAVNTLTVMHTEPAFRGRAFGVTMSAHQLGSMVGPLAGGLISAWSGIKPMFVLIALLYWAIAAAAARAAGGEQRPGTK